MMKQKYKTNPFADQLQPGEEIMWFWRFRTDHDLEKWYSHRYLVLTAFLLFPLGISFMVANAIPTGNQAVPTAYQIESFLQILLGFFGPFMLLALLGFIADFFLWHNVQNYAITNQRILFRSRLRSRELYLTEIKDILVREGTFYIHITYRFRRWTLESTQSGWVDDTWTWNNYPVGEDKENLLESIQKLREFPIVLKIEGHKPVHAPSGE